MYRSKIISVLAISLLLFYKPETTSHAFPATLPQIVIDTPEVVKTLDSIHKNKIVLDQKVNEGTRVVEVIKSQVNTIQSQTTEINNRVDGIHKDTVRVVDTVRVRKGFLYKIGRSFIRNHH